ncbi:hypothetical protein [Gallibacter intestinalis]|uniref:HhH-GPD domain-containing protein n=1 Tax=Gallibacter intestinalis TaxID=2779356 RepID=A0ABR9QX52_9FIRM|nr:hypothetical protein [Gallibacter intestinalis]MBE5035467.1 hypothetical protein [Gallibacter intestinalis]
MVTIDSKCEIIEKISAYASKDSEWNNRWEKSPIPIQINKRKNGIVFGIQDHIRAMVYSMFSSNRCWSGLEKEIDEETGKIRALDKIFYDYDVDFIKEYNNDEVKNAICDKHFGNRRIKEQVEALKSNIEWLVVIDNKVGIDKYYKELIANEINYIDGMITLIDYLAPKFKEMGVALTAEYLRNAGYDIAKPDIHLKRIMGSERLGWSLRKEAQDYEAIYIVNDISANMNCSNAWIDYVLWSYCAKGHLNICKKNPNCGKCVIKAGCNKI